MDILIINSKGHWLNGWAVNPEVLEIITGILRKAELSVNVIEVSSIKELQDVLEKTAPGTLVWPNAYLVNDGEKKPSDLVCWVEKYQLPLVGSSYKTLQQLIHKDFCQSELKKAGIPVPPHIVIKKNEISNFENLILDGDFDFPVVLKPTKESRSNGIELVHNLETARHSLKTIFEKYPDSDVIIEAFLPGDDVTCGYFALGGKKMLLPTYCTIEGLDCKKGIYSEYHYTLPHTIESHPKVENSIIIQQLEKHVPRIVKLFNIHNNTRIDARLDNNGKLNFFDVNGMPGLNFPSSAVIKQVFTHFLKYDKSFLFGCLIHTIIGDSLLRCNMPLPSIIDEQNLFNLESQTILNIF